MISLQDAAKLPILDEVDVLVAGGGPAGFCAGFAAARKGRRVLIVEQFNCLGGVAAAAAHGCICKYSAWGTREERVVGGIMWEVALRLEERGWGVCDGSRLDFEVERLKLLLEEMAAESGCEVLYHVFYADTVVEDGAAVGAVVQCKDGRCFVRARRIIDCTGDGDAAFHAGCAFDMGDEETGLCQPMTLMFILGGVDWGAVREYLQGDPELEHAVEEAVRKGDMRPFQRKLMAFCWTPTRPEIVCVNFTHVNRVSALKVRDLTYATMEGRRQAYETVEFFRKYVPGMEKCFLVATPPSIGIRESRRVLGRYRLTVDDVKSAAAFPDSIGYGSFFIDIHNTKGPGMDEKTWFPPKGFRYQIPYRILVPRDVENLLVAGRCASCDHEALGSLRVMPQCGVMGQAAGTAATLSLREGIPPSEIDVGVLQAELKADGCIVDEEDVCSANAR